MSDESDGDQGTTEESANMAMPMATAAIALIVGAVLGGGGAWVAKPPVIEEVPVPRDYTAAELEKACAPLVSEATEELRAAENKVSDLTTQVETKQARVVELEEEMKRRGARGAAMHKELEQAKTDLEDLRAQLAVALEEKEAALEELKATIERLNETTEELDDTKKQLNIAEEDALQNRWTGFVQNAQLTICEKGNRKKLGRCRETIEEAFASNDFETKFRHCIKAGEAVPSLHESAKKQTTIPEFSLYLNEDAKQTRDWYVMLCDPTLPEAEDLADVLKNLSDVPVEADTDGDLLDE